MRQSDQLISFAEDLAVLLNAGSDLDSALGLMVNSRSDSRLKPVLSRIRGKLRQGVLLSSALQQHPEYFDNYVVAMVRSGEASGQLATALEQLAEQLESSQELKNQINNALVYPAILAVAMALSLALVLGVILPKLTGLFESFGGDLSFAAKILLAVGQFMATWGQTILFVVSAAIIVAYLLQDQLNSKQRIQSLLKRIPFIRRLLSQIEFARFTSTLSSLLASGLSQIDALAIAAESFRQASNRDQIELAISKIKEGQSLSSAIKAVEGLGDLYAHSIESGERAGQLPATLSVLARRLEKDFSRRAQRLASLVEPILILALGLVIGLIIYTVFAALQGMGDLPL
ncbi:MAG: type II secretion system F family protein [Arenicella sp.]|nr:type II secretion system F family protein [Arenicella sp.]